MAAGKVVRALTIDCSGAAPVVESTVLRKTEYGDYSYSYAGTPAPVAVPGTSLALVAAYGALQVWDTATGTMISESATPGDIAGLWPDPDDPTRCIVPCWLNQYMTTTPVRPDTNTIAEFSGIGTATPTMVVRETAYREEQNIIGSTDATIASPGLIALVSQNVGGPTLPDELSSVETINIHTGATKVLTTKDDWVYYDTIGSAPIGGDRTVALASGLPIAADASASPDDDNQGVRAYFVDHRDKVALHIVDAPHLTAGIPVTDGVSPTVQGLSAGSHGFATHPKSGRTLVASTVVSRDFAAEPNKESRYSVVANLIKAPAVAPTAPRPAPEADWTDTLTLRPTGPVHEGFYAIHTTDGGNTVFLTGEVPADADHVKVGPGPTYLEGADYNASYLQVHHVMDTNSQFLMDSPGVRFAAWEPPTDVTLVDLTVIGTAWSDATGYNGALQFTTQMYAFDAADLSKPGVRVGYNQSGVTSHWATAKSGANLWYREERTLILDALSRGDLIIAANVGTAYYADVTSRVASIALTATAIGEPKPTSDSTGWPEVSQVLAHAAEGFWDENPDYSSAAETVTTFAPISTDANHTVVGTAPVLATADADGSYLHWYVVQDGSGPALVGPTLAAWSPPEGGVLRSLKVRAQVKRDLSSAPSSVSIAPRLGTARTEGTLTDSDRPDIPVTDAPGPLGAWFTSADGAMEITANDWVRDQLASGDLVVGIYVFASNYPGSWETLDVSWVEVTAVYAAPPA